MVIESHLLLFLVDLILETRALRGTVFFIPLLLNSLYDHYQSETATFLHVYTPIHCHKVYVHSRLLPQNLNWCLYL